MQKTVGAATTHYIYAGGALIAEADGATGVTTAEYIAFNGINLAWIATGSVYFVHVDHLGTPQMLTDETGAVVWDADYRPFGEATITGALAFNLRFPGQYFDTETGLHYNYFRDYDAGLGRYVQSDPIGLRGGWNTYAYVGGNPVMKSDLLGLIEPDSGRYEDWIVHPFSILHTRRNEKNKCPNKPPEKDCDDDCWKDHIGNKWTVDSSPYHKGESGTNKTWRRMEEGWQCTYDGDLFVNSGEYQGTYDYEPPYLFNLWDHYIWDVRPHEVNPVYVDYLTTVY